MKESEIRPTALFNRYLELARQDIERFFADKSEFVDVPCPACGSPDYEFGLEKFDFSYVTCRECGSLYLSPRPTDEMINIYYRQSEAVKFWGTHFFKETVEARREKMFRPRAQLVAKWANLQHLPPSANLADIGPGYGVFLEEVTKLNRFSQVIGVEPAPNLAAICRERGYTIIEKPVEEIRPQEVQTSFVTAFEVLEHVYDPLAFLQAVRSILKPGGVFLFTTLTVSGFDIQVLWEHSKSVYPPHHINLLSVEGMGRLVQRAGLQMIELTTPGKLDVDIIVNIQNENPEIPLPRFVAYLLQNRDESTRQEFQNFLKQNRLSSHIQIVAIK